MGTAQGPCYLSLTGYRILSKSVLSSHFLSATFGIKLMEAGVSEEHQIEMTNEARGPRCLSLSEDQ